MHPKERVQYRLQPILSVQEFLDRPKARTLENPENWLANQVGLILEQWEHVARLRWQRHWLEFFAFYDTDRLEFGSAHFYVPWFFDKNALNNWSKQERQYLWQNCDRCAREVFFSLTMCRAKWTWDGLMTAPSWHERDDFLQKTLYVADLCHNCNGFAKVAGLDHDWLLKNNCQPKKSRKRCRSCERYVILEKGLYVAVLHSQTDRFLGFGTRGHQVQTWNNCQLFWCITYGKSTLIPQPYAHSRLPPLYVGFEECSKI